MSESYRREAEVSGNAASDKYVRFNTKVAYLIGQDGEGLEFGIFFCLLIHTAKSWKFATDNFSPHFCFTSIPCPPFAP